jgi:hypothetical protein
LSFKLINLNHFKSFVRNDKGRDDLIPVMPLITRFALVLWITRLEESRKKGFVLQTKLIIPCSGLKSDLTKVMHFLI